MKKIILSFLVILNFAAGIFAVDFPMPHSDSRGSSFVNETVVPPLTIAWSYNTFAAVIAGPVAADNKVFVGNQSGAFYCFDAFTGEVVWQYSTGGKIESAASYYNGIIYFASRDGYVYALDAQTGTEIWTKNLGTQIIASPVVHNGRVFIGEGAPSKDLLILNAETGLLSGSFSTLQPIQSNPVFGYDKVFFGSNDGRLYCIHEDTLLQAWYKQTDGFFTRSSPLLYEAGVFMAPGHDERKIYRAHIITGAELDSSNELYPSATRMSSPAEYDDTVYVTVSTETAKMFALDANDLKNELWVYVLGGTNDGEIVPAPTVTRNHLYTPMYDGRVAVLDRSTGAEIQAVSVSEQPVYAQAAVSNGYVYFGLKDGYIKAYKAAQIVALNSPSNYKVVTSTGVDVYGTVILDSLIAYTVEYGAGETPSIWTIQPFIGANFERSFITQLDASALPDGIYTLRIKANNNEALMSESRFILNLPPEPPSNLTLSRVSSGLKLAWTLSPDDGGGDNDVTAYRIYRSLESGSYSSYIGTVSGGLNSYIDTSLISGVTYYYVVRSYDGFSESANSNEGSSLNTNEIIWVKVSAQEGGQFALGDGTKAIFPPGALDEDYWILIKTLYDGDYSTSGMDSRYKQLKIARLFQVVTEANMQQLMQSDLGAQENLIREYSNAVSFNMNVTVVLPYSGAAVDIGDETKLRILWYDDAASRWKIINTSTPDPNSKTLRAQVSRFAVYQVAEFAPSGPLLEKAKVYTYPNPAKGDTLWFKYFSGDDCFIYIDVYNVAGEKIAQLEGEGIAGLVSEIAWDIKKYASGIYMYVVEAKSKNGNAKKKIVKKLAIIK